MKKIILFLIAIITPSLIFADENLSKIAQNTIKAIVNQDRNILKNIITEEGQEAKLS